MADYMFELFNGIDIAAISFEDLVTQHLYAVRDFSEKGIQGMIVNSGTQSSVGLNEKAKRARVLILPH